MTLRAMIATDVTTVFTSTSDFAEAVLYYPRTGGIREIDAVVIREPVAVISEDGDTVAPTWQVHVANSDTLGISGEELDTGGDQIGLSPRDGQAEERRSITQLLIQDHGMLVLECR